MAWEHLPPSVAWCSHRHRHRWGSPSPARGRGLGVGEAPTGQSGTGSLPLCPRERPSPHRSGDSGWLCAREEERGRSGRRQRSPRHHAVACGETHLLCVFRVGSVTVGLLLWVLSTESGFCLNIGGFRNVNCLPRAPTSGSLSRTCLPESFWVEIDWVVLQKEEAEFKNKNSRTSP